MRTCTGCLIGRRLGPRPAPAFETARGLQRPYNTNYLQVETEVISEMLHAIEIARTIQKIDQHYNIAEQLKRKAFQLNEEKMMEYFREIIRQSDDYDPKTLEEDAGKLFRSTSELEAGRCN